MIHDLLIESVSGREIIDSRGNPTVEAEVRLRDGSSFATATRAALAARAYWTRRKT